MAGAVTFLSRRSLKRATALPSSSSWQLSCVQDGWSVKTSVGSSKSGEGAGTSTKNYPSLHSSHLDLITIFGYLAALILGRKQKVTPLPIHPFLHT